MATAKDRGAIFSILRRREVWIVSALLVISVLVAYARVWQAGFIWDDDQHVIENRCVIGPLGFREIWTTPAARICPLVISSFRLQWLLWGARPLPFHLVNVLFHTGSALVLWRALRYLQVPGAAIGAALWALHPVQVESVAWITELKNAQSGFFYLLCILFFLRSLGRETTTLRCRPKTNYALAVLFGALAMASKSSTVVLPLVLGLCAWFAGRLKVRILVRLLPFVLLAIAASALSIWTQNFEGADDPRWPLAFAQRLALPGMVVWFYLAKLLWPYPLIFIYPRWNVNTSNALTFLPNIGLLALCLLLWWKRTTWLRAPLFALLYFVIALLPVLGLHTHFFMRYSFVGDHFQYLASMGPLALAGAGLVAIFQRSEEQAAWLRPICCALLLTFCAFLSWQHSAIFHDSEILWRETLRLNPNAPLAENNLGHALMDKKEIDEAMIHFQNAARMNPKDSIARANIGLAKVEKDDIEGAMAEFKTALAIDPAESYGYFHLGNAFLKVGRAAEAVPYYEAQLKVIDEAITRHHLAAALSQSGREVEAISQYQIALRMNPTYADAWFDLGMILERTGQVEKAIAHYEKAIQHNPQHVAAHNNLAWLLATSSLSSLRDGPRAVLLAQRCNSLTNGQDPAVLDTLAAAYAEAGDFDKAVQTAELALQFSETQTNHTLSEDLRRKIELYRRHTAFRSDAQ